MESEVKSGSPKVKKTRKERRQQSGGSSGDGGGLRDWLYWPDADILKVLALPFKAIWWVITHILDIILFPFKLIGELFSGL